MSPRKKAPPHPLAKAIDDVLAAGHTPRIHVDARRGDVTVPDHVRERWQARLVIDLDPGWPLNLEHEKDGLAVDLAFQGMVSRCKFGWAAIYVVLDRATGRGTVVEAHLPPHELPPELGPRSPEARPNEPRRLGERRSDGPRPSLVAVSSPAPAASTRDGLEGEPASAQEKPRRGRKKATEPVAPDAKHAEMPPPPPSGPEAASSDDLARERRARFRVINGGG